MFVSTASGTFSSTTIIAHLGTYTFEVLICLKFSTFHNLDLKSWITRFLDQYFVPIRKFYICLGFEDNKKWPGFCSKYWTKVEWLPYSSNDWDMTQWLYQEFWVKRFFFVTNIFFLRFASMPPGSTISYSCEF